MAKKYKEPDKLAFDMMQCVKDGYGCHYGAWKAVQDCPVTIEKKVDVLPEGWKVCPQCGKSYKPNKMGSGRQIYCDVTCQRAAQRIRRTEQERERKRRYRERKKAERSGENGQQTESVSS